MTTVNGIDVEVTLGKLETLYTEFYMGPKHDDWEGFKTLMNEVGQEIHTIAGLDDAWRPCEVCGFKDGLHDAVRHHAHDGSTS